MLGTEIDRFASDNAKHCKTCANYAAHIGRAWSDLNHAIKLALKWPESSKGRERIAEAKKERDYVRDKIQEHMTEHA